MDRIAYKSDDILFRDTHVGLAASVTATLHDRSNGSSRPNSAFSTSNHRVACSNGGFLAGTELSNVSVCRTQQPLRAETESVTVTPTQSTRQQQQQPRVISEGYDSVLVKEAVRAKHVEDPSSNWLRSTTAPAVPKIAVACAADTSNKNARRSQQHVAASCRGGETINRVQRTASSVTSTSSVESISCGSRDRRIVKLTAKQALMNLPFTKISSTVDRQQRRRRCENESADFYEPQRQQMIAVDGVKSATVSKQPLHLTSSSMTYETATKTIRPPASGSMLCNKKLPSSSLLTVPASLVSSAAQRTTKQKAVVLPSHQRQLYRSASPNISTKQSISDSDDEEEMHSERSYTTATSAAADDVRDNSSFAESSDTACTTDAESGNEETSSRHTSPSSMSVVSIAFPTENSQQPAIMADTIFSVPATTTATFSTTNARRHQKEPSPSNADQQQSFNKLLFKDKRARPVSKNDRKPAIKHETAASASGTRKRPAQMKTTSRPRKSKQQTRKTKSVRKAAPSSAISATKSAGLKRKPEQRKAITKKTNRNQPRLTVKNTTRQLRSDRLPNSSKSVARSVTRKTASFANTPRRLPFKRT